jgi:hypothetical protein
MHFLHSAAKYPYRMERAADTRKQLYIFNLNKKLKILKTQME